MATELWERLNAARARSGLKQIDVMRLMNEAGFKLSRASVALHESGNADQRTKPDAEQVMQYARIYKIPAEMLVDSSVSTTDIALYRGDGAGATKALSLVHGGGTPEARIFWGVVQLQVGKQRPERARCFEVMVERHGVKRAVPFLHDRSLAVMSSIGGTPQSDFLEREVPSLLFLEKLTARTCRKHLLVHVPPLPRVDGDWNGRVLPELFDCTVAFFTDPDAATRYVLEL